MREHLKAFYLEYLNACITVAAMSDYKHMTEADTQACIDMGRRLHEEDAARAKTTPSSSCTYAIFYKGKSAELKATSLYEAKQAAISYFRAPRSQHHMVSVVLSRSQSGEVVTHTADF